MKNLLTSILIVSFMITIILPISSMANTIKKPPQQLKPGKVHSKMMVIKGDNAWLSTGFILKPSDKLIIKASGEVSFNHENGSGVGPNGYKRLDYEAHYIDDFNQCGDPIETNDVGHAALIGKDANDMFLIGAHITVTGKKGLFYIGINDCTFKENFYNTGQFHVNIKVIRGK